MPQHLYEQRSIEIIRCRREQNSNIYNHSTKIHGGIRNLEEQQLQEREIKP